MYVCVYIYFRYLKSYLKFTDSEIAYVVYTWVKE